MMSVLLNILSYSILHASGNILSFLLNDRDNYYKRLKKK